MPRNHVVGGRRFLIIVWLERAADVFVTIGNSKRKHHVLATDRRQSYRSNESDEQLRFPSGFKPKLTENWMRNRSESNPIITRSNTPPLVTIGLAGLHFHQSYLSK